MLNTLGIVEVRLGHGEVESKIGRKLGGKSLLEWAVRRVTDCQRLDGVVALVGDPCHVPVVRALVPPDVSVFAPAANDPLAALCCHA